MPPPGRYAAPLATLTMRPLPRSTIHSAKTWQQRYTPRTFTSNTCHHSRTSGNGPSGPAMPALFTSRSTGPASPAQRATSSRFETSPTSARPPISFATERTSSAVRPVTSTSMPARASSRAMFAPMPRPPPVTSAFPLSSADSICDLLQGFGVLERRDVSGIGAHRLCANGSPDDLRRSRLRQRAHPEDPVGLERLPECRGDGLGDSLAVRIAAGQRDAEDPRHLALHLVRDADRRGLGDDAARERGRLQLRRSDPLACDVQRVVAATVEEPVAVLVHRGPVAVRPDAGEAAPVRVEIALVVAPDPACHPGPRAPADELAHLAAHGVALRVDDVHVLTESG